MLHMRGVPGRTVITLVLLLALMPILAPSGSAAHRRPRTGLPPLSESARAGAGMRWQPVAGAAALLRSTDTSVTAISAGGRHTCAVVAGGTVYCWGQNSFGQVGDGTNIGRAIPTQVGTSTAITTAMTISAGNEHSCAVLDNATARCWGRNAEGQLGDSSVTSRSAPVIVGGATPLGTITALNAGSNHTCAVLANDTVRCWGNNFRGQLGDGTTTTRTMPVVVGGTTPLTNVLSISAGQDHTCAVVRDGTARCWGYNIYGQLGDGTTTTRALPAVVGGTTPLTNVVSISVGALHSCAQLRDGTGRCWGSNPEGQFGNAASTFANALPIPLGGTTPITSMVDLSVGDAHTCIARSDARAWCAGWNTSGQIGTGATSQRQTTFFRLPRTNVLSVSAGGTHSCATRADGTAYCWGRGASGELGNGTVQNFPTPIQVLFGPLPTLTITGGRVVEGNSATTSLPFTVTLSAPRAVTITVNANTQNSSALAGSDYSAQSSTLTFAPGVTEQIVQVQVTGDTTVEPDETLRVNLSSPNGATVATSTATGTILNDDVPHISIDDSSQNEGMSGTTSVTFTVSLSASSGAPVMVGYATADGTATIADSDYQAASGMLRFDPGQISQTVTVLVNGDTIVEADETFAVTLSSPSGATLADGQGQGTILNDDTAATPTSTPTTTPTTTPTATATPTPTTTPTTTPTATATPTPTTTPTGTATSTATVTPIPAATATPIPAQHQAYLPLIIQTQPIGVINPNAIPLQAATERGMVFWMTTITLPASLPTSGRYVLSSDPAQPRPAVVDDGIVMRAGATELFRHDYGANGMPQPALVVVPLATLAPWAGQPLTVQFVDIHGDLIRASPMYLVWTP